MDIFSQMASERGLSLELQATFSDTLEVMRSFRPDFLIVGPRTAKDWIAAFPRVEGAIGEPESYIPSLQELIEKSRAIHSCPILT